MHYPEKENVATNRALTVTQITQSSYKSQKAIEGRDLVSYVAILLDLQQQAKR